MAPVVDLRNLTSFISYTRFWLTVKVKVSAYWYRCYRSIVRLFVCLSVSRVRAVCSNGRRYWYNFFCIYDSHMFFPHRSANLFLPNFAPKWPSHVSVNVGDIRWQIAAEWLEIAQWSQRRAYMKPPSLLRMAPSQPPRPPLPPNRVPIVSQDQLRDASCYLANTIEDIDKISFISSLCYTFLCQL